MSGTTLFATIWKNCQTCLVRPWRQLFWLQRERKLIYLLCLIWILISGWLFVLNEYYWHFPYAGAGQSFFQNFLILWLLLSLCGALLYDIYPTIAQLFSNYCDLILCFWLCQLVIIAIQTTPYSPIDTILVHWDHLFHVHIELMWQWTKQQQLQGFWRFSYFSIAYQMLLQPIFALHSRLRQRQMKFVLMNLLGLIGMLIYFRWPTIAPAFAFQQIHMQTIQQQIWERWYAIHCAWLWITPIQGLIAFPSFHVFWAMMMVWFVWPVQSLRWILLILNFLLSLSTMMLGCHYLVDLIGSAGLLLFAYLGQTMLSGELKKLAPQQRTT